MWRSVLLCSWVALSCTPNCIAAFKSSYYSYVAALLSLHQQDIPAAVAHLSSTVQADPDAGEAYRLLLTIGAMHGDATLIVRYADPSLEHIESVPLLLQSATALLVSGYPETAGKFLEKAVQIDPDNGDAVKMLGRLYLSSEPARAAALYERYLLRNPDDLDALFQSGIARYRTGNPAAAAEVFRTVVSRDPAHQDARTALWNLLAGTTRQAEVEHFYREYLASNPDDTAAAAQLIVLLLSRGTTEEARPYVERLQRSSAARYVPELTYLIATFYEQARDYRTAVRSMERHLQTNRPHTSLPFLKLASYYIALRQYRPAERILLRTMRDFDSPDARRLLVYLYIDTRHYRKAEKLLLALERKQQQPERVDFLLAHCYDRLGNFAAAEQRLLRALERDPDDHEALNYLGYSYADRNVHLDRAEELIVRALQLQPENPAYLDSMGWVHYRRGRFREAEEYLRRASEKLEDAVILEHLGDTYRELGNPEEAVRAYRRALSLDPKNRTLRQKLRSLGVRP